MFRTHRAAAMIVSRSSDPARLGDPGHGRQQRPDQGDVSGSATTDAPWSALSQEAGSRRTSGRYMTVGQAVLEGPSTSCAGGIANVNEETLTAPDGSTLTIRSDDVACPIGTYRFHGTGSWVVVGGTGRSPGGGIRVVRRPVDFIAGTFTITLDGLLEQAGLMQPSTGKEDVMLSNHSTPARRHRLGWSLPALLLVGGYRVGCHRRVACPCRGAAGARPRRGHRRDASCRGGRRPGAHPRRRRRVWHLVGGGRCRGYPDQLSGRGGRDAEFRIGSISKTFVAVALLQLAQQGKIGLDTPIDRYLPGLLARGATITIRELLQHRAGLADTTYPDGTTAFWAITRACATTFSPVAIVKGADQQLSEPGTTFL